MARRRCYSPETACKKNSRRAKQRLLPLEKLIYNATCRAKNVWKRGSYGQGHVATVLARTGESFPQGIGPSPYAMSPCTYYSPQEQIMLGYQIRVVRATWCSLLAIWGHEGVICIPIQFVEQGHREKKCDPGLPPTCNQCDQVSFSQYKCVHCDAPLFYHP